MRDVCRAARFAAPLTLALSFGVGAQEPTPAPAATAQPAPAPAASTPAAPAPRPTPAPQNVSNDTGGFSAASATIPAVADPIRLPPASLSFA